jgi:xanthine dehydrogenase YagR molybdenum-binding subunit
MDPIELRRRNEPERDPVTSLPFSGRRLMDCFDEGARRFAWSRRSAPGGTSDGDWLIGVGCASAAYPANIAATAARVRLNAAGKAHVEIAGHDIGTGAYTVVALIAAEALGIGVEDVSVSMGDTALPPASLAAGSSHSASIAHAVQAACDTLARQLRSRSGKEGSPLDLLRAVTTGAAEAYGESVPPGLPEEAMEKLYSGQPPILRGHSRDDVTAYSFGAQFVEVSVHRVTREIRIRRMLGVFASGRIINPLTAYSQYMGGMIWGIGAGLLEKTEIDPRSARYTNDNLGEYLVPVNADVGHVDVVMLDDRDEKVNRMGIKGIGEIGIVGVNAAIANAVYNATGRRVRRLPIRIEDILDGVPGV